MKIHLTENAYGKNAINLSKIIKHEDHHEFRQISVNVSLTGDFETAYTVGDNSKIIATDTQKNTVYALAKEHFTNSIEEFGIFLADYFMTDNPQVSEATIDIVEYKWIRMNVNEALHPHAYISGGNEKRTTKIVKSASSTIINSGIDELLILKTTDSGFENFIRDKYTTLKETSDRIFSTKCKINWQYEKSNIDYNAIYQSVRKSLLQSFAHHNSLSVQQTLYTMAEDVLSTHIEISEISLAMPNKHHILYNMEPFGMENNNEIFIATDEPYGYITGTVVRDN
jgi:urate oxidase